MTIHHENNEDFGLRCHNCGANLVAPWFEWSFKESLALCSCCCDIVHKGFIADLLAMKCAFDVEQLTGRREIVQHIPKGTLLTRREDNDIENAEIRGYIRGFEAGKSEVKS